MIYHVYYNGLGVMPNNDHQMAQLKTEAEIKMVGQDQRKLIARLIKETKGNQFVFIVTKGQLEGFKRLMLDGESKDPYAQPGQGLRDYLSFEMKQPITNGNYPEHGRKLWMFVFKTKE